MARNSTMFHRGMLSRPKHRCFCVFFLTNNEYPDISKSARTSTVVYCSGIVSVKRYKGLFIALVGQLVPVAQQFTTVACSADVQGLNPAQYLFFNFFSQKT